AGSNRSTHSVCVRETAAEGLTANINDVDVELRLGDTEMVRSPIVALPLPQRHCILMRLPAGKSRDGVTNVNDLVPRLSGLPASAKITSPTTVSPTRALTSIRPELAHASALKIIASA